MTLPAPVLSFALGMAFLDTAANETAFPMAKVRDAYEAWRAGEEAREQREEALLAAYNAQHLGPRNQRTLAYESYVADRKPLYDRARRRDPEAIRRLVALQLPEEVRAIGISGMAAEVPGSNGRYPATFRAVYTAADSSA